MNINITQYDTDVTLLYKAVREFNIPSILILSIPVDEYDKSLEAIITTKYAYVSVINFVNNYIYTLAFDEVYFAVKKYNRNITPDHMMMVLYHIILTNNNLSKNLYIKFNECYQSISPDEHHKYFDNDTIEIEYQGWIFDMRKLLTDDLIKLNDIEEAEKDLDDIYENEEEIMITTPNINTAEYLFQPVFREYDLPISHLEGLDIFNNIIVCKRLPIVVYVSFDKTRYTKIYSPDKSDQQPNYNNILIPQTESNIPDAIYMRYWVPSTLPYEEEKREAFRDIFYDLRSNNLFINLLIEEGISEQTHFNNINELIPMLDIGQGKEIRVGGSFQIYNKGFSQLAFADMIMNDKIMSNYLFLDENQKLLADKKKFDIHFKAIHNSEADKKSVTLSLRKRITRDKRYVDIEDKVRYRALVDEEVPYIHCNILQAASREVISNFMIIFKLLMKKLFIEQEYVDERLYKLHPELVNLEQYEENIEDIDTDSRTCRPDLQEMAPDLFVPNYSKRCACENQPKIIEDKEELEYWQQQGKSILSFPNKNPKYWFVCPKENRGYIGVKENRDLPNKDLYPYIPCCFKEDRMTLDSIKYQNYLNDVKPEVNIGAKADKKITTRKILSPDKIAFIPRAIYNMLKRYSKNYSDIVRYGVPYGVNSLLHCVCIACDDPNYMKKSLEKKEVYISQIRDIIVNSIYPTLLRQELFDYQDEEIMEMISDENTYLNPDIYYRAVEEVFNINIYTFTSIPPDNDGSDFLGDLSIPRSRLFHSRPLRLNRPTVVVIKIRDNDITHDHCELIVDYDNKTNKIVKLFGESMTNICHDILINSVSTFTWNENKDNKEDVFNTLYKNIYYTFDHINTFQLPAKAQYIDENGKLRGLVFELPNKKLFTLITLPSQPENLPITNDVYSIDIRDIYPVLGLPQGYSYSNSKIRDSIYVDMLWYDLLKIPCALGIHIYPIEKELLETKGIQEVNRSPLVNVGISLTNVIKRRRKTANILKQLLKWLFVQNRHPIDVFIKQYFVQGEARYDFTNLNRILPLTSSLDDSIGYLQIVVPSLFKEGKIIIPFVNKLSSLFISFSKMNLELNKVRIISNYYSDIEDFDNIKETKIFTSDVDLYQWLKSTKSLVEYSKLFQIYTDISITLINSREPYIYKDIYQRIWLIQNVKNGNFFRALSIVKEWKMFNINLGYDIDISDVDKDKLLNENFVIYKNTNSSELFAIKINTVNDDEYLNLLYYGEAIPTTDSNNYAAMIQLM